MEWQHIVTPTKIELKVASALKCVSVYTRWSRVEDARIEGVVARRLGIRYAGIEFCCDAKIEPVVFIERSEQIEAVALIKVRPAIFTCQGVLVRGKPRDAARVVVGMAEGVLRKPRKPAALIAAECKVDGVASLSPLRLDLTDNP